MLFLVLWCLYHATSSLVALGMRLNKLTPVNFDVSAAEFFVELICHPGLVGAV